MACGPPFAFLSWDPLTLGAGLMRGTAVVLAVHKEPISGFRRLSQQAPAQVSQDICPVWKHQSNSMKLVPGRKLVDLQGKPTQAAKRETSIQSLSLWGYVESGLEDGHRLREVLEMRLGITERRQKSHFSFLSVHSKAEIHSTNISRVLIVVIIIKIAKIY